MQYFQTSSPPARRGSWRIAAAIAAAAVAAIAGLAQAQTAVTAPTSLARATRPEPANLGEFVANKGAAIALGKALFWDTRLGSDGKTACASCHFQAGADNRSKNQLSPGLNKTTFAFGGPNYKFRTNDFPLHQFANPDDRNSAVVRSMSAVASSQGVFNEKHVGVVAGQADDARQVVYDPVFHIGVNNTRRVEPRNSPTVINAVFNLRNFWDGRAQTIFNGVNPWGKRDFSAHVFRSTIAWNPFNVYNPATATTITLNDSSLRLAGLRPAAERLRDECCRTHLPRAGPQDVQPAATGQPGGGLERQRAGRQAPPHRYWPVGEQLR